MGRFTRVARAGLAAALVGGVALGALVGARTPRAGAAPVAQEESGCFGTLDARVASDTIRLCDQTAVTVVSEPTCPSCPGGVNVVFVEVLEAFQADWQNAAATKVLAEIERVKGAPVKVGVVHYDSRVVKRVLRMTDRASTARGALNQPRYGHDPHGDFEGAAKEAIKMLDDAADELPPNSPRPCQFIVFFASTKSIFVESGRRMIKAGQMIRSRKIPLLVGCPETNPDYCTYTKQMAQRASWYAEPPGNSRLSGAARGLLEDFMQGAEVRGAALTQIVPAGLAYVDGSAVPVPAAVEADAQGGLTTTLRWDYGLPAARGVQTVTFRVAPRAEGVFTVTGAYEVTDTEGRRHADALPAAALTVTGPCTTPTPEPTPTATAPPPPPPTPTRVAPTATPVPPTPTATATRAPVPIYLPITLYERCSDDERLADVVLVIDMSTSMNRAAEDGVQKKVAVLDAARAFLARLDFTPNERGQQDQAAVVGFNDKAWIEQSLSGDRAAVLAALDRLDARQAEGTRLDLGLREGALALPESARRADNTPVMIFLTDGLPNRVPADPATGRPEDTVIAAARAVKDAGIQVYTIGFGRADAPDIADRVYPELLAACATRPDMAFVEPRAERIGAIYAEIADVFGCPVGRHDWSRPWP